MRILVAEDDPVPRRMLQAILQKWDYEVVVAADGNEAWRILQGDDAPAIAILDWLMPEMDGVEVCRRMRQRPDAPYVYVILLTSKDRKEDIIEGMEAGADDYLIKPFESHRLQVRLRAGRRILDLQAALLASVQQVAQARERENEIGARIQQTLLLGRPPHSLDGVEIAALTIPSQQIDGDFYDFFQHSSCCMDVVVGDVMGKGVPAALFGAAVKSHFLRALGRLTSPGRGIPEPEEIVAHVHSEVTGEFIGLDMFMTLCYARFDQAHGKVTFVDAGHTKTIHLVQATGELRTLEGDSLPLGISEREVYRQVAAPCAAGDLFCFYSDGITEARREDGEMFGFDRLAAAVRRNAHLDLDAFVESLRRAVTEFSGGDTFADDLTCVAVRIKPASPYHPITSSPHQEAAPLAAASMETRSALSELPAIRAFVRAFCLNSPPAPLDSGRLIELELAVNEAASNIMRHAYDGLPDMPIRIEAEAYPDRTVIRLYNTGKSFDPAAAP
ncbi:MAG TPA: SpoIIE family protein phosphatase, partial [Chthonomonadaceae bacterium]|nr:SpoIIE family protein phosphatase [Chthonomonadaceae bacterium]